MLSGLFGLIAIETSAGLMAEASVIRTICCAELTGECKRKTHSASASRDQVFMYSIYPKAQILATDNTDHTDQKIESLMIRENPWLQLTGFQNS